MRFIFFVLIFNLLSFDAFTQIPVASFYASKPIIGNAISVCQNETILFYNNSTSLTPNASYQWSFGNGASPSSSIQNSNISVVFSQVGAFTISLQVNNNNGQPVSIHSIQVNVLSLPIGSLSMASQGSGFSTSTYNGIGVFKNCNSFDSTLFSFNLTSSLIAQQTINWGDGEISSVSGLTNIQHLFGVGQFNVTYQLVSTNGCTRTYNYIVFNGSSPVITVSGSGQNTCVPFPYPIDIISNDVPISYFVSYSDNTSPLNFTTDNDTTISHVFNSSSCGQEYYFSSLLPPIQNAYSATIVAQNLCSANGFPTVITIGPITISQGVEPLIDITPISPICLTETVTFSNVSISGLNISSEGCDSTYSFFWQMQESSGYTLSSGDWGSDSGFGLYNFDPIQWQNGTSEIAFDFQNAGIYHLKLFVGSPCGIDSVIKTFEIKPLSSVQVNVLEQTICSADTIAPVIFTSVVPDYNVYWEITDSQNVSGWPQNQGVGASPLTLENWILFNTSSETGYVDVSASVGCSNVPPTVHRIYVNPQGDVFVNPELQSICNHSETNIQISSNLSDAQFSWVVSYNPLNLIGAMDGSGDQIVQLLNNVGADFDTVYYHVSMSNSVCPGVDAEATVIVQPDIYINPINDWVLCPDEQVPSIALGANLDGVNFQWENSNSSVGLGNSGNGNIPSWSALNNTTGVISAQVLVIGSLNNCPPDSIEFSVVVHPIPTFDYTLNPATGLGCSSPMSIIGSTNILNPVWTWTGPLLIGGATTNSPEVNESGDYHVVVTDNISNCQSEFDVWVDSPTEVSLSLVQAKDISCWGFNDGQITVDGNGGMVQYQWLPSVSTSASANDLAQGTYQVSASNEDGCTDDVSVEILEPLKLEIQLVDSVTSQCGEANGLFLVAATGGVAEYALEWSNGSIVWQNDNIDAGAYGVEVTDANGCVSEAEFQMPCVQFPDIVPFQFISPNADGKNDTWILKNLEEYENAEVFLFNRWGSLVYYNEHYQNDWNGTCNKCSLDAETLPSATYYYKVVTNKKSKPDFTGFIEIQP